MALALSGLSGISGIHGAPAVAASTTVTIGIAVGTDDGKIQAFDAFYPPTTIITKTTNQTVEFVRKQKSGSNYPVINGLLRFDTSSLAGKTISAAYLNLFIEYPTSADARNLVGDYHTWSPIVDGDYTASITANAIAAVALSSWPATLGPYQKLTLLNPDANINKSGYTGLRLGIDGGAPTGDNSIQWASADGGTNIPQLVITYS